MSIQKINVIQGIGPSFSSTIWENGLGGLSIHWYDDVVEYEDNISNNGLSSTQIVALQNICSNHNPNDVAPIKESEIKLNNSVEYANQLSQLTQKQLQNEVLTPEFDQFISDVSTLKPEAIPVMSQK